MRFNHLYIHVPFCQSKCHYCDFTSYPLADAEQNLNGYGALLEQELQLWQHKAELGPWRSIYWGGGTPSLLPLSALSDLMALLKAQGLADNAEITLEANPESLTAEALAAWQKAGINRLSIGVQSFDDELLAAMNRPHTAAEAYNTIKLAQTAGFTNISLDLIYGLPEQNLAAWQADLEAAVVLAPQHISLYGLSLSKQSVWGRAEQAGSLIIADQDLSADLLEEAIRFLPQAGFKQYEIANFAKSGFESRHNTAYWQRDNYLGLGAAASSCAGLERWNNQRDLGVYQACLKQGELPRFELEQLSIEEVLGEALFLGLRQTKGLNLANYQERYGISPLKYYRHALQRLQKQGLVEVADGHLRLTERGLLLGNEVFEEFV